MFWVLAVLLLMTGVILLDVSAGTDWFYFAEGFIVLCVVFLVYFYIKVLKTLNAIVNGMELLKEQDFGSRLAEVGQRDADRIVDVFNMMMLQLKTERLHHEEQNYFLDLLIKNSPMGVIILDFNNRIVSVNTAGVKFMGFNSENEMCDKLISELSSPLAERLKSVKQGAVETIRVGDVMIFRCSRLSFVDKGFQHPFILIESLTEEVMKAEKKAYEKVIRMIAHEVNNSVAGVTSSLDSLRDVLDDMENTDDLRDVMSVCIERCYGLSDFITRFADVVKIPEPVLNKEDLNDCAVRCKLVMENMCSERNITINMNLCDGDIPVLMDASLFEHVLVNIIKNSVESIGRDGNITITTCAEPAPMIEIADTGTGITGDTADKLFTPFFSTKPNGQGLGLIFIREVLLKHNCRFSLRTGDDRITRFTVKFQ